MARFKVPQNLEMEDRIIANLTMWQFAYLVVGGMLTYAAYMKLPTPLNLIVAAPLGFFTLAASLLKVNDQPFPKFFLSFLHYMITPRQRVWHKEGEEEHSLIQKEIAKKVDKKLQHKAVSPEEIKRLAQVADSHGFSEIDQQ